MSAPSTSILELTTEPDWVGLQATLDDDRMSNAALAAILEQLKAAGAKWALVENDYLDRDYSEEFNAFYGRLFRRFRRHTRRLHFFKTTFSDQATSTAGLAKHMEEASVNGDYLGFAVIRPVKDAPIGRVVIDTVTQLPGLDTRLQVRATYDTHPLGAQLSVRGVPFTQQDARISACAQASIWMSGRHFNARHGGPWSSTVAITEAASQPTDISVATALPAGSCGLNVNNMLRAVRSMDRHPYAFMANRLTMADDRIVLQWPGALEPAAILARYVESGIPVIVGLRSWERRPEGHAVVVVGDSFQPRDTLTFDKSRPTIAEFSPYFLVHDDQRGPNLRMGVQPALAAADTPYNVRDHLEFIIVPLPDKVFIPGEAAERTAWDYLRFSLEEWPGLKAEHGDKIGSSTEIAEAVLLASAENRIVARTYLTFGWKYKARMLANTIASAAKERIALQDLPRMVWVTELGLAEDLNHLDANERLIFGHCVIDATSTGPFQPPLIFHAPGFLTVFNQEQPSFYPEASPEVVPVPDDRLYHSRVRNLR